MDDTDRHEAALKTDLAGLGDRFTDEKFCTELYRALAGGRLVKDGMVYAPSWSRAERLVNDLRAEHDREPLTLAQTGDEGEVSDVVAAELQRLQWSWKPRDTSRDDPAHSEESRSAPPSGAGERGASVSGSQDWERRAHDEADATQRGLAGAPPESGPGEGAGGGEGERVGGS
ncbi:MAG: hypothetical protein AVDCRST_MAG38-2289 [uncultured Solirubrobacteraceae bacterium]|uniref:Uncharacterized protein n=1 Tax=uncultured Solirubrobacteraceae bacterium TaxID=1162706 RepID=A0A6J4S5H6_9ACTN|nr:MAG: hypothetical protein AVDCRST_MAG38-2289 [uncultured Solirubrobacteraceae bacterium]